MRIKRNFNVALFIILNVIVNTTIAQDLSSLSENERKIKLIEIAKDVYKAPRLKNFYREFGTPAITEVRTSILPEEKRKEISENQKSIWYGSSNNQKYYVVYFYYDLNKERFDENYAAKVYIWENLGKAFAIQLGNKIQFPVRDGKIPGHDTEPEPIDYYNITYSKDVPELASLPKKGKYGDVITIKLKTIIKVAKDGWTREEGYNFDKNKDLTGGYVLLDEKRYFNQTSYNRIIQIKVTGDLKINVTEYIEEYEAPI